ncbi:condensation domain-containing protein [Actinosynnema sp. NPDC047251]|uniref:Putative non-ribosomal peptide synthase n=1 Tax=Saccharothrix espanaensis (strain ATCC 51144 / DSM 44229 / JCM 9112 / NBRC 15066 / NRRL 15764) TaxID=1179773 RepID=K0K5D7_SACES|nr:condensation domain-containing protein [Saccharothrix espanaensis]CCH32064.1 putative non-ribosomal peptide synthase [Saccharothrix espanaensis DSM 44229]
MSADRFPLSPAARRLWTLSRIRPGDPFFNHPFAVDVDGPLDVDLLGRCLTGIVRRHEPLRSRVVDGLHVVEPATPVELSVVDGTEEDGHRFGQQPFDLAAAPPFRVLLLRLGPDRHRLVVNVHHIVIDGLSLDVFLAELVTLYGGGDLPDLPVRFGDLPEAGDDREYWITRLAGAPPVIDLPMVGPRPMTTDHRGERRARLIPADVVDRVRQVARRGRATSYMALKAACDVVLAHYGNDDVLMGMALSGRDSTAHAGLIGYLVKPVVLRTDLRDDPTFAEVVQRVRNDVLDAHDHPDLPLEDVLAALAVTRDPSYHPVFQVMFTHTVQPAPRAVGEVTFTRRDMRLESQKVELTFGLTETARGVEVVADYRVDLFDGSLVDSMLERLEVVLRQVGENPDLRVSELRSAGVDQRAALSPPVRRCVHELFADRVAERPDAVAVDADRRWTYRELDDVATGVAARLAEFGVGPEVRVGVCAGKSAMVPAAVLGVLKAGGVCVPLDPALPAYLVRAMAEQYELAVVLADERTEPVLATSSVPVLRLDVWPARPVTSAVTPDNAAFVLPTAGQDPQAVVVEHRAFVNSLRWKGISSWPMAGPLAWAATVFEVLAPLTTGGTLGAGPALFGTPAVIAEQHVAGRLPGAVRTIVTTGGTPLTSLREALPQHEFVDLYATAETSVALVDGRPLDGVRAYVLDERLRPVPPGSVGALHIGGHGLARGYLDDPAATDERFHPDPFDPEQRIFATGDLARSDPDGTVHVVRRSGRVDLAAVESVLLEHPAVRRAHAFDGEDGEDGAVAVAVVRQGMSAPHLREWLAERLPHYTVPPHVRTVDTLPVLPGGKPDRDGVLRLLAETPDQAGEELPLTDTEQTVTRAWTSVLGRTVGVRDNFFDAGGNSLLLVRLCEQLRIAFDRHVGVTDLFRHPTVRAMAEHLAGTAEPSAPDAADRGRARQEALRARGKARQHR